MDLVSVAVSAADSTVLEDGSEAVVVLAAWERLEAAGRVEVGLGDLGDLGDADLVVGLVVLSAVFLAALAAAVLAVLAVLRLVGGRRVLVLGRTSTSLRVEARADLGREAGAAVSGCSSGAAWPKSVDWSEVVGSDGDAETWSEDSAGMAAWSEFLLEDSAGAGVVTSAGVSAGT